MIQIHEMFRERSFLQGKGYSLIKMQIQFAITILLGLLKIE